MSTSTLSVSNPLDRLAAADAARKRRAQADYRAVVRSLASGEDVHSEVVEQAITAAGVSVDAARDDLTRLQRRVAIRADFDRCQQASDTRREALEQLARLERQLLEDIEAATRRLKAQFQRDRAPLAETAEAHKADAALLDHYSRQLRQTADPAALQALAEAQGRREQATAKLREVYDARERLDAQIRSHSISTHEAASLRQRLAAIEAEARAEQAAADADVAAAMAQVDDESW